ncbi:MAG: NAD-dependent epimerase/dehydratase family protein, partial [Verrucomicrobiales bacterium]
MKILISGSHGMVGQALLPILKKAGHETAVLVRRATSGSSTQIHEVYWEPSTGMIDTASLRKWGPPDALIHLAGKNIAEGRWTRKHKEEIRDSRVEATRLLCESLLISGLAPKTYIAASATGIYGNRGEEILNEQSPPGNDFLASVT